MRIILLTDEYLPSSTRVHAKMMHELALVLKDKGHEPIVLTPGTPNQETKLVEELYDGIKVWYFKSNYIKGFGLIRRAINEWLIPYRAWSAIKIKVRESKFDLCINYSPTIFFGPLANRFKQKDTFVYLILRDFFPQWIIDSGLIKENSLAARFFRFYENLNYSSANCIGVQSKANLDLFQKMYPSLKNVQILRNWSAIKSLQTADTNNDIRDKLGIEDKVIFFYGGNIGFAQDMKNIMKLAKNLRNIKDAHFLIIGQGDEFNLIKDLKDSWGLENVTILPSIPQSEFSKVLASIDIGLFSLSYFHTAHNFPGKILGYMLESKPILGSVNPGNDLLETVNYSNSGLVFINGEDKLLVSAAKKLIFDKKYREACGRNAKNLLLNEFSVQTIAEKIISKVR